MNPLLLVIPASIRRQPAHVARWRAESDAVAARIAEIFAAVPDVVTAHAELNNRAWKLACDLRAAAIKPRAAIAASSLAVHLLGVERAAAEAFRSIESLRREQSRLLARQRVLKVLLR